MEARLLSGKDIPVESMVPQWGRVVVHQEGSSWCEPVKTALISVHVIQRAGAGQLQQKMGKFAQERVAHGMRRPSLNFAHFGHRAGTGQAGGGHFYA